MTAPHGLGYSTSLVCPLMELFFCYFWEAQDLANYDAITHHTFTRDLRGEKINKAGKELGPIAGQMRMALVNLLAKRSCSDNSSSNFFTTRKTIHGCLLRIHPFKLFDAQFSSIFLKRLDGP